MHALASWLAAFGRDLRLALRLMRRNRAFSAIAVVTLALGIGADAAVYSLLDAVVLHPLGYPEPDRLYLIWTVEGASQRPMASSYQDFNDCRRQAHSFDGLAAFRSKGFNLTGGGAAARVPAIMTSPGLFETLRVTPALGRASGETDGEHVAVISHGLWVRRFGADSAILGKTLRLDGAPFVVIGVLPRGFHFQPRRGDEPDVFVPLPVDPQRGRFELTMLARLGRAVTPAQAQSELNRISARIAAENADVDRRQRFDLSALHRNVTQGTEKTSFVLLGAVVFLLLIACVNVANLLVARGVARDREIAIRLAIGASRGRLVRQLLTESLLLALLAGATGLGLAYAALPLLAAIAPVHTQFLNRIQDNGIAINAAVLAFTVAVSVVAAILFGILPAMRATRPMRSSVAPPGRSRTTGPLIAVEVALSFILLAGAGLMVSTLWHLLSVDPGFRPDRLLTMSVSLPDARYPDAPTQAAYVGQAVERLRRVPGVRSVAAVSMLPMTRSNWRIPFEVDGPARQSAQASFHAVSAGYFETMGIPVVRGRDFTEQDRAGALRVAIVSRRLEQRYFSGSAVGRTVIVNGPAQKGSEDAPPRVSVEIVGVVGDVHQLGLDADPRAELYMPAAQRGTGNMLNEMTFVMRAEAAPTSALASRATDELRVVDPDQPITDVKTMDELIATDTASPRFVFALIGLFAAIAVALAAFGIYGVVSQSVARRSGELAVRLALGARPADIVGLVARQHLSWLAAGVAGGVVGALELTRLLANQLFGVRPVDPPTYAAAAVLLALVAVVADLVPATHAARVMPAQVLRRE